MDIRVLRPSDIPHVQLANITNLPENYFCKYYLYHAMSWPQLSYVAVDVSVFFLFDYDVDRMIVGGFDCWIWRRDGKKSGGNCRGEMTIVSLTIPVYTILCHLRIVHETPCGNVERKRERKREPQTDQVGFTFEQTNRSHAPRKHPTTRPKSLATCSPKWRKSPQMACNTGTSPRYPSCARTVVSGLLKS